MKTVSVNKKASFNYHLLDQYSAGLVLKGSEVKSLRAGGGSLKESYIVFKKHEAFLWKAHIAPYKKGGHHSSLRMIKLLLNYHELVQIKTSLKKKGLTCIPLKIYFEKKKAKLQIALARGKKKWDKRESEKKKTQKKEISKYKRRRP